MILSKRDAGRSWLNIRVCLIVCLFVVFYFVCFVLFWLVGGLFVCLFVCLFFCLFVCLFVWKWSHFDFCKSSKLVLQPASPATKVHQFQGSLRLKNSLNINAHEVSNVFGRMMTICWRHLLVFRIIVSTRTSSRDFYYHTKCSSSQFVCSQHITDSPHGIHAPLQVLGRVYQSDFRSYFFGRRPAGSLRWLQVFGD